jgi:hypothetical protein
LDSILRVKGNLISREPKTSDKIRDFSCPGHRFQIILDSSGYLIKKRHIEQPHPNAAENHAPDEFVVHVPALHQHAPATLSMSANLAPNDDKV